MRSSRLAILVVMIGLMLPQSGVLADTVIAMPLPASESSETRSLVMTLVDRAMEISSQTQNGMEALYRYSHARRVPYHVYHVDPNAGRGSVDWDFKPRYWNLYPRQLWGSYGGWGWWGWPGCVIWNVGSPPTTPSCRSTVFAVL